MQSNILETSDGKEHTSNTYGEHLRWRTMEHASSLVSSEFRNSCNDLNSYHPEIIPPNADNQMRDYGLSISTSWILNEAGLLQEVAETPTSENRTITINLGTVTIDRYGNTNVGLSFKTETGESSHFTDGNLQDTRNSIREKVLSSPIAIAFQEVSDSTQMGEQSQFSESSFNINENPALSVIFLNIVSSGDLQIDANLSFDSDFQKIASEQLENLIAEGSLFDENGIVMQAKITIRDGVELILSPTEDHTTFDSLRETNWKIAINLDPSVYLVEKANQAKTTTGEMFLNRPTGEAFLGALLSSGIYFSDSIEDLIITGSSKNFADRYGGPFTHLSRTLAKVLSSGEIERLNKLFIDPNGNNISVEQLQTFCNYDSDNNGLKAFQTVLRQVLQKQESGTLSPLISSEVRMNEGSCFDVAQYYISALKYNELTTTTVDGNTFLGKKHGAPTMINTSSIEYNGVMLPPGSLFRQLNDGQLLFLRFTPFMFDTEEEMVSAFGTEIMKAKQVGDPMAIVSRLQAHNAVSQLNS